MSQMTQISTGSAWVAAASLLVVLASSAWGARIVARRLGWPRARPAEAIIALSMLGIAWCLLSVLLPATIAEFAGWPLVRMPVIAALACAAAAALGLWDRHTRRHSVGPPPVPRAVEGWWTLKAGRRSMAGTESGRCTSADEPSAATAPRNPVPDSGCPKPRAARRIPRWLWLPLAPVALLHAFLLVEALSRPPTSFDGVYYHLPAIVQWLRAGRLDMDPAVSEFSSTGNGEVWQMLFASLRVEPLIEVSFIPLIALLAIVLWATARELGATHTGATVAAALALGCPLIALQAYSSYTDVFGTVFLLGALYWAVRFARATAVEAARWRYALLIGLCGGIAVGTKLSFGLWLAPILLALAAMLLRDVLGGARPVRRAARLCVLALVLALPVGVTFWWVRATHRTGWPLYPTQITVAGVQIGRGMQVGQLGDEVVVSGPAALGYPWFEWKRSGYPYSVDNGLGPQFAGLAVIGAAWLLVRRRWWTTPADRRVRRILALFFGLGLVFFVGPLLSCTRWTMPLWAVMFAAAGPLLDLLLRFRRRTTAALVGVTLAISAAVTALWPAKSLLGRLRAGDLSRACCYEMPRVFDELPSGTVVLNLGPATMNYPLLGTGWRNQVIDWMTARVRDLQPPLTAEQLTAHHVEIVYHRGDAPPPFAPGVSYETLFDDAADPRRPATSAPTRVYRVQPVGVSDDEVLARLHSQRPGTVCNHPKAMSQRRKAPQVTVGCVGSGDEAPAERNKERRPRGRRSDQAIML